MKFTLCAVCLVVFATLVAAEDSGYFLPKAFYTINARGVKSDVRPINADTLKRMRRETIGTSSSSSSSSVSTDGGPVYFTSQQVVTNQQTPSVGLESRFGGAPTLTGKIVQTVGRVDPTGKITYKTTTGQL